MNHFTILERLLKTHHLTFLFFIIFLSFQALFAVPVVTNVSPHFGPAAGGNMITLTGTGFTGSTAVDFDNSPATSFIVNSDTSIMAQVPIGVPGTVHVNVTAPSGTSSNTSFNRYTYQGDWIVYVASQMPNPGIVSINTITQVVTFQSIGSNITDIAITPDGKLGYVTDRVNAGRVFPWDLATYAVGGAIATGGVGPRTLAITPDGTRAYVPNQFTNTVIPIDLLTNSPGALIPVGSNPAGIAITPDGTLVYVTNEFTNDVRRIDVVTNTVVGAPIMVGSIPFGLAITPDGQSAYVVNYASNNVSYIDLLTNTVIGPPIPVGINPVQIAITPDGQKAYVNNQSAPTVTPINLLTNTAGPGIPMDGEVAGNSGVAITPDGSTAYVSNGISNRVYLIDVQTDTVTTFLPTTGTSLFGVTITPDQSPVAYFDATIAPVGSESFFDASASVSPVGTIEDYTWDFGDGVIVTNQFDPMITHTYTSAGVFLVTLTVTNTAGTSTTQVFTGKTLSRNGGADAIATQQITVPLPPPAVTNVNPNEGPLSGGNSVTITGTNFTGATTVLFGSTPAISFIVQSDNSIQAIAPPGAPISVDVSVTTPFGTSTITPADQYTYVSPPLITQVNPNVGPTSGGNFVTITGTNFTGATTVLFGSTPAISFIVQSDNSIQAIAPPGAPSSVDVSVTTPFGTSAITPADQYTYVSPPLITQVNPNAGPTSGGNLVTITGTNFTGATTVLFGATPAISFTVQSDNSIQAIAPPGDPGSVDVRVTTPFGTSAITPADQYAYIPFIFPSILPPRDLKGHQVKHSAIKQTKHKFTLHVDVTNILTWKAPFGGPTPVSYRVYQDKNLNELIAVIPADHKQSFKFKDRDVERRQTYHYFVVSVDQAGNQSIPAQVLVPSRQQNSSCSADSDE